MCRNDTGLCLQGVPVHLDAGLSPDEVQHSQRLREAIAADIAAAGGWISFERYMELALYAPGLGYYSAGARKLGAGGDFTTAPEVSSLFGCCVAKQCAEVLGELGHGSVLEVGAGTGRLAVDILSRLEGLGSLPTHYFILEVSADLRERQRSLLGTMLPHLIDRVRWLDVFPAPFEGLILANEVLDALPVARFRYMGGRYEELGVGFDGDEFVSIARAAGPAMTESCRRLVPRANEPGESWDGYVSEYSPTLQPWSQSIAACLNRGAILWMDYGLPRAQYYLAERHEGTLLCHFRQRAHDDPFLHPGLQDITAWVDFTSLAEAGRAAQFDVAGFTTQAFFLAGLGVDEEMRRIAGADANSFARLANQARQLMLPGEMGERFKAMAWRRGIDGPLSGFALQDLRHTL
jgi:SAM-dependent MidA family methyltransferase